MRYRTWISHNVSYTISHAISFTISYKDIALCVIVCDIVCDIYYDIVYDIYYDIFVDIQCDIQCDIQYQDVTVACTTEMPLPIELVKAQLKVWEYKCVLIVGNPHWPYAYKTTETYTYEYAMLTPSPHKMKVHHETGFDSSC